MTQVRSGWFTSEMLFVSGQRGQGKQLVLDKYPGSWALKQYGARKEKQELRRAMALGAGSFGKGFQGSRAARWCSEEEQPLEEVIRVIWS